MYVLYIIINMSLGGYLESLGNNYETKCGPKYSYPLLYCIIIGYNYRKRD